MALTVGIRPLRCAGLLGSPDEHSLLGLRLFRLPRQRLRGHLRVEYAFLDSALADREWKTGPAVFYFVLAYIIGHIVDNISSYLLRHADVLLTPSKPLPFQRRTQKQHTVRLFPIHCAFSGQYESRLKCTRKFNVRQNVLLLNRVRGALYLLMASPEYQLN